MANQRNNRRKGSNPLAVLANDANRDPVRSGAIASPRKVMVTARVSIGRDFHAPRLDMGEYGPVRTVDLAMVAGTTGWNGAVAFEPGPTVINEPRAHVPVGLDDRLLEEFGTRDAALRDYLNRRSAEV